MLRVSRDHLAILRVESIGDDEPAAPGDAIGHQYGLRHRGRAVVERRVGYFHTRQLADHRLELERVLQRALTEFRLIRRVCGEELSARDQRIYDDRNKVRIRSGSK